MTLRYICNCPDSSKNRNAADKIINWQPFTFDWSSSGSGAIDGQCKHILATRIIRGELKREDIPKDLEFEILKESEEKEKYQRGYAGHSFTGSMFKFKGV